MTLKFPYREKFWKCIFPNTGEMPSKMTQVSSAGTRRNTKKYNKIKLPTWFLNQWSKTTAKVQWRSRCAHTNECSMVLVTSPATSYWDLVFLNSVIARIPSAKVSECVCVCVCVHENSLVGGDVLIRWQQY